MKVVYIAQYADAQNDAERYMFSPGGVAKMEYFLYCMAQMGIDASVYSSCLSRKRSICGPRHSNTTYGQKVHFALTFKPKIKLLTLLGIFVLQLQLFLRLLFSQREEVFFVYHERFYSPAINLAKRLRRLKFIIDVEEIYSIHAQLSPKVIDKEICYLKGFDRFTLANIHLAKELGLTGGGYAVCNGIYAPIECKKNNRNKLPVNVLYAGTFNRSKGGADAAIEAFKLLDDQFKLYVCGFGTDNEIAGIKTKIDRINESKGYEAIVYEGFIPNTSERYLKLLEWCNIGLSTQNNTGKYNATSFPSKIFEYMRHGMKVVSTRIPGTEELPVSQYITFINSNSPDNIANGIKAAALSDDYNQNYALESMHLEFIHKFNDLLTL